MSDPTPMTPCQKDGCPNWGHGLFCWQHTPVDPEAARIRRAMDADRYDPSPDPVTRRVS
jgi:hypothetical protein